MAPLTLDLTGKGGLAPRFWGDIDRTSVVQNLRYLGGDDQMADGIYNPMRRYGYLSPSNAVFNAVTDGTTENFSSVMSCSIYDAVNDDYYYGMYGTPNIYKGDGLDDVVLAAQTAPTVSTNLFDLEIYQVNGVRKLFYVYNGATPAANYTMRTTLSSDVSWFSVGGRVNPVGAANPSLLYSVRDTDADSSTTHTKSITVPAGSNKVLVVIAATYNDGAATDMTATWDGNAMAIPSSGNAAPDFRFSIFTYTAPTAATGNVVVTYNSAVTHKVMQVFVFDAADQTTPFSGSAANSGSTSAVTQLMTITANYQVAISSVFSATSTHNMGSGQTSVFNAANTSGTDSVSYFLLTTARLRVGIASLPFASQNDSWLTATVSGAFANSLTGQAFMENSDNGLSYLFQDNVVHKIDGTTAGGTNGTISANVLTFPTHYRCIDAVDYRGTMFIGIHKYSSDIRSADDTIDANTLEVGVYLWDRNVSLTSIRDIIPLGGAKQLRRLYVAPNGKVRAIVINSERVVEIREYNGSTFETIQEVGYNSYPAFRDSVATFSGMTTWLGRNGIIYSHGAVISGEKDALYKIGTLTDMSTTAVSAGAILYGGEDTGSTSAGYKTQKSGLFLSYFNGTNNKVKEWDIYGTGSTGSTVVAKTCAQGDVYTLVKYLPQMSTVKDIEIFMVPGSGSGTTTAGTIKIYFNQSATAWASKVITADDCAKGYKRIDVNKPFINSIQLEIEYPTTATIGTLDFAPSVAIVEFEPTVTKG